MPCLRGTTPPPPENSEASVRCPYCSNTLIVPEEMRRTNPEGVGLPSPLVPSGTDPPEVLWAKARALRKAAHAERKIRRAQRRAARRG